MEINRCSWCQKDDLYRKYHDTEWGIPVYDDATLFAFLLLETFQAGLSWYTILCKREAFAKAFDGFSYQKIANYNLDKQEQLMQDTGIVRNRLKIKATVSNAIAFIKIQQDFGSFSSYLWQFVAHTPIDNKPKTLQDVPSTTDLSDAISRDLKKRGFKFVGSTVVYAYLQAVGVVNDHVATCWTRQ